MAMITLKDLESRLKNVKYSGSNKFVASCPCSENHSNGDNSQSLSVTLGDDGKILIHCHTGCDFNDIVSRIGVKPYQLFPEKTFYDLRNESIKWFANKKQLQLVEVYEYDYDNYRDGLAKIRFINLEETKKTGHTKKTFAWLHPDSKSRSGFTWSHKDCPNRLYVRGSLSNQIIIVVEGEKDVNNTYDLTGITSVCSEDGAGSPEKWRSEYTEQLIGKEVYILGDNDKSGISFAKSTATALYGKAEKVYLLDICSVWEDCPEKGDISDMIDAFGKDDALRKFKVLKNLAFPYRPPKNTNNSISASAPAQHEKPKADTDQKQDSVSLPKLVDREVSIPEGLAFNRDGEIKNILPNYVEIIRQDPKLGKSIRFNQMTRTIYIKGDLPWKTESESNFRQWTDIDRSKFLYYLTKYYDLRSESNMDHAVNIVADENAFHPIRELLDSLVWDGVKRIDKLLHLFLGAADDWYSAEIMKLIMMGALNRVYHPGSKFDYSVTMIGDQGKGKSTFVRVLAMDDEWTAVLSGKNKFNDAEDAKIIRGKWIVELEEMSIMRKADQDSLKGFLTRQTDRYRDAYSKYAEDFQRSCIFIGTTNRRNFLSDKTGNRRFIPIEVNLTDPAMDFYDRSTSEYIRQAWAEAMTIYRSGDFMLYPTGVFLEKVLELQGLAEEEDPFQEMVEDYIQGKDIVSTSELFDNILNERGEKWNVTTARILNDIMSNMPGWKRTDKKVKHLGKTSKCYVRKGSDRWRDIQGDEAPFDE